MNSTGTSDRDVRQGQVGCTRVVCEQLQRLSRPHHLVAVAPEHAATRVRTCASSGRRAGWGLFAAVDGALGIALLLLEKLVH